MGHAVHECEVQRARAFEENLDEPLEGQQVLWCAEGLQRAAFHVFHGEIGAIVVYGDIIYLDDVGMLEAACQRGLGLQLLTIGRAAQRIAQQFVEDKFDSDLALCERIEPEEDVAGRAFADQMKYVVLADTFHAAAAPV
jgi:hypothetical protein